MVYCPKCGKEFAGGAKTCDNCGENLKEEKNFLRVLKIFDITGIILLIVSIIVIVFFRNQINSLFTLFLFALLIFLVLSFLSTSVKRKLQYFIIKVSFGGLTTKQCPECENLVSDEDYCLNCGYPLKNVRGYFLEKSEFVELNKKYIRVFKTYRRYMNATLYRFTPVDYDLEVIKKPEVSWCTHLIFTNPCLRFNYQSQKVEIPINQEMLPILRDLIPNLNGPDKINGIGTWFRHQNKVRVSAVTITLLILLSVVSYASYYTFLSSSFTPQTQLTLLSTSSSTGGLEFSNVVGISHSSQSVIEGYLKNNGNTNIQNVWVNCTGYDSAGNIVASHETYLEVSKENTSDITNFQPGSTGYFKTYLDDPENQMVSFKVVAYQL